MKGLTQTLKKASGVATRLSRDFNSFKGQQDIPAEVGELLKSLGVPKSEFNAKGKNTITPVTPITGEKIGTIAVTNTEQYKEISSNARVAADEWRKNTHTTDRSLFATTLANIYEKALPQLAKLNQLQTGKLFEDAKGEENESVDIARKAAGYANEATSTRTPTKTAGEYVVTSHEPVGVVANIGAYNYPGLITNTLHMVQAVAAGNSVIIKPNELNPLPSLAYKSLFKKAAKEFNKKTGMSVPKNLVQYVQGGAELGELITNDTNVDKVVFTGSSAVGQKVREAVVKHGGREPLMETGGHNAMGITSDVFENPAALQKAMDSVMESYFGDTSGQRCSCLSRLYVPRQHLDKVVGEVLDFNKAVVEDHTGDPRNLKTILGPMMHPDTIKNLNNIKDAAAKDGATVYGGKRIIEKGYEKAHYMEPILIVEQGQNDRMLKTEPFGPCMHIIPVDKDKDMPKLMNAGKKDGLTSSFHTLNPDLMNEYHLQVKAGNRNENQKTSGAPVYAAFGPHNGGQVAGQGDASFKQYQQRVTTIESTTPPLSSERSPSVQKILDERVAKMAIERDKNASVIKQLVEPERKNDYFIKSVKSDKQVLGKG